MKNGWTTCAIFAMALASPGFAQQRFDSADAAAQALIDGAAKHDQTRLSAIFGPQGNAVLTSGKPDQDRAEQSEFSRLAETKHQLLPDPRNPNRMILSIGEEDWPFPVPLVRSHGKWSFDASETRAEMDARRIGSNELDVIEICAGYVQAQKNYAAEDRSKNGMSQYASHMVATGAAHDGLGSLVPQALAEATWDGQKKPVKPYHGYYFRILEAQGSHAPGGDHSYRAKDKLIGGFGLVAWPAIWRERRSDIHGESRRRGL